MNPDGEAEIQISASGDTALVACFGERIERAVAERVIALARRLAEARPAGVIELVPTFRSLMVHFDPDEVAAEALADVVRAIAADLPVTGAGGRRWIVPACYDPVLAPDLMEVAALTGLAPDEVAARHSSAEYFVYMIGFLPGYPYMGDVPEGLVLPRRADPRLRVPAGSLAIAQTMTAIYPFESPGGWHLIGRVPVAIFTPQADPPALFAAGDVVRFEPISHRRFTRIATAAADGRYRIRPREATP